MLIPAGAWSFILSNFCSHSCILPSKLLHLSLLRYYRMSCCCNGVRGVLFSLLTSALGGHINTLPE